jgi:hypothetical protein
VSRSLRRVGTAQAGFPRDRGWWVASSIAVAIVLGGLVGLRGPYGGPLTGSGAAVRILALLAVAALPPAALLWAWRRVEPWVRRVTPVVVGVLSAVLLLLAAAHANVYAERVGMDRDPERQAAEAYRRGDYRFWAVEEGGQTILAPPVLNRCVLNRYGVRVIPGATGVASGEAHRAYLAASLARAEGFNRAMLARLHVTVDEAERPVEGFCPPTG